MSSPALIFVIPKPSFRSFFQNFFRWWFQRTTEGDANEDAVCKHSVYTVFVCLSESSAVHILPSIYIMQLTYVFVRRLTISVFSDVAFCCSGVSMLDAFKYKSSWGTLLVRIRTAFVVARVISLRCVLLWRQDINYSKQLRAQVNRKSSPTSYIIDVSYFVASFFGAKNVGASPSCFSHVPAVSTTIEV